MFPLAHIYLAEKYFDKLTNEIKFGTTIPDFLTMLPIISIEDTHKLLINFDYPDFARAWNLHILLDNYSEEKYFYPLTPDDIRQEMGKYVGHIFVETALDYILLENGIYYSPPKIEGHIIPHLEKYFKKDLTLFIPYFKLFVIWDREKYLDHLADSILYICGVHHHVLTKSEVENLIDDCKDVLPDYEKLFADLLANVKLD